MSESRYYVPPHSGWPALVSLGLFLLAFGSLNLEENIGHWSCYGGGILLLIGIFGWIANVTDESKHGLYNQQMNKTFRWGMFWFLISELFLFGSIIGAIIHVKYNILPWLSGSGHSASVLTHYLLWPDFSSQWPLYAPPGTLTSQNVRPIQTLIHFTPHVNTLLLMLSSGLLLYGFLNIKFRQPPRQLKSILWLVILFGLLFCSLQGYFLFNVVVAQLIQKTGIYGSLFILLLAGQLIHLFICVLLLIYFLTRNLLFGFAFEGLVWFWIFLTLVYLISYFVLV
jgi:cytochrome c oxidase subunit III